MTLIIFWCSHPSTLYSCINFRCITGYMYKVQCRVPCSPQYITSSHPVWCQVRLAWMHVEIDHSVRKISPLAFFCLQTGIHLGWHCVYQCDNIWNCGCCYMPYPEQRPYHCTAVSLRHILHYVIQWESLTHHLCSLQTGTHNNVVSNLWSIQELGHLAREKLHPFQASPSLPLPL